MSLTCARCVATNALMAGSEKKVFGVDNERLAIRASRAAEFARARGRDVF